MPRQSVRVQIFHQSYTLLTEGDPAELQAVAQQIDELMTSIAGRTHSGDSAQIAVLAWLHLADKLRAAETKLASYERKSEQISEMLEEALADAHVG